MSTPTPSSQAGPPGSGSKRAYASPANRAPRTGMPSPVAARRELSKTPAPHGPTSAGKGLAAGGTPMARQPSSQAGGVSSSPGHTHLFGTPLAGLGLDLNAHGAAAAHGTPAPNALTPAMMVPSLSGLSALDIPAAGAPPVKRNEDAERRAKIRKILRTLGGARSRVCEESIARASRRAGLANDIDAEQEVAPAKVGNRTIGIAGKTILIDVELRQHVARNVAVMFSGEGAALEEQGAAAGEILLKDLRPGKDGVLLSTSLDAFARHLGRLARVDRLSDKVNCFEALSGVYTSLQRLYLKEVAAAKALLEAEGSSRKRKRGTDERAESEVLCRRSGRPSMHARGEIGLALAYYAAPTFGEKKDGAGMDVDNEDSSEHEQFTLQIDVEACPADLYPPLRNSDAWLPAEFDLPSGVDVVYEIPWLDPPPTYIAVDAAGPGADAMDLDTATATAQQKLPDLRFVARLSPPVIVPFPTASNIFTALGAPLTGFPLASYPSLLLDIPGEQGLTPEITATQRVCVGEAADEVRHRYTLDVPKPEYGYRLEEIPFAHPRQLVEILPTLRQWAAFGHLLRGAFLQSEEEKQTSTAAVKVEERVGRISLADGADKGDEMIDIEMTLLTTPDPALSITIPSAAATSSPSPSATLDAEEGDLRSIDLRIGLNGAVLVAADSAAAHDAHNAVANGDGGVDAQIDQLTQHSASLQRLGRALEACGMDVGVWVEWLRRSNGAPKVQDGGDSEVKDVADEEGVKMEVE